MESKWKKSSYSQGDGNCVEWKEEGDGSFLFRNSKDPNGPAVAYTRSEIEAFVLAVKDGELLPEA